MTAWVNTKKREKRERREEITGRELQGCGESSQNNPIIMSHHFISIWVACKRKKKDFSEVCLLEQKWREKELLTEEEIKSGKGDGNKVRSDVTNRAERKNCRKSNSVNVCLGEMTDKERRRTDTADSFQHSGQLLLSLLTDTLTKRSCIGNPSFGRKKSLTNSWSCNCTNCCINTTRIFSRSKSAWRQNTTKDAKAPLFAGAPAAEQSHTQHGWYYIQGEKNPGQKDVHVRTHTLQGLEDCSQVIAKLTSSNCSLKCLPPDWLKRLSNGSCNKPCHMLLGNKQKQNKKKTFFCSFVL